MKDKGFKKQSIKQLSQEGKIKLFNTIEKYINAKIDERRTSELSVPLNDNGQMDRTEIIERAEKATEELQLKLLAMSIQLE